ncbi:MAG: hypothetical protein OK436_07290, partial [Thaumarchaeota archaeon]|nr:hypothetical protein [Nitrososphaerota archaeon]
EGNSERSGEAAGFAWDLFRFGEIVRPMTRSNISPTFMRFQNLEVLQVERYYGIQGAGAIDVPGTPEIARETGFVTEGLCRTGDLGIWPAREPGGCPAGGLRVGNTDPFGGSEALSGALSPR